MKQSAAEEKQNTKGRWLKRREQGVGVKEKEEAKKQRKRQRTERGRVCWRVTITTAPPVHCRR